VTASSLTRTLEPTVALMVEMLTAPGARAEDLERIRAQRKTSLEQRKAAPGSLGSRLWASVVFGPDHPYGRLETTASIDAIKVTDCRKIYATLDPSVAQLFVSGDIDEAGVRALLEQPLAELKPRMPARKVAEPPRPQPRKGTIFLVNIPGASQSQIYVGHPGPDRTDPDYEANELLGAILGGSFSGRVNMNIREDKGFAYGARAGFTYYRHAGWFAARSSVRTDATGATLRELAAEIAEIRATPVRDEELDRERQAFLLGLPARFETAQSTLSTYARLVLFGLPLDYYDGYVDRFGAVSAAAIQAAAQKNLRESEFSVLVVGDAEQIRADLDSIATSGMLGSQGLVLLDPDGHVVG
jgi:zinc protease